MTEPAHRDIVDALPDVTLAAPALTPEPASPTAASSAPVEEPTAIETQIPRADLGSSACAKEPRVPKARTWKPRFMPLARPRLPTFPRSAMKAVPKPALAAAALALAAGLGFAGGRMMPSSATGIDTAIQRLNTASADLRMGQDGTARIGAEVKAVRVAVDALRGERDRTRGELITRQDRTEKAATDATARLAKVADQLERMEKAQRDPARLNAVLERIERLEAKMQGAPAVVAQASTPTPPPKPAAPVAEPAQTGSLPELKVAARAPEPDPRRAPLDGYVLREVDDGMALVERRDGRFYEVAPGMSIPGIGKVEGLERRGRHWVVLTPKGYISER